MASECAVDALLEVSVQGAKFRMEGRPLDGREKKDVPLYSLVEHSWFVLEICSTRLSKVLPFQWSLLLGETFVSPFVSARLTSLRKL